MHPLVEQLQDLFARAAGPGPHKIAIDAGRDLLADGNPVEQLPPDVAVGYRPDHAPASILRKQNAKPVGVETPKRLLDRFGLNDGNESPVQQLFGSKGADSASVEGR